MQPTPEAREEQRELGGITPAAMVGFNDDLTVDLDLYGRRIDHLLSAGAAGVVVNGAMGEAGSRSRTERSETVRAAVEVCSGRGPVTVGVSAGTTADAVVYASDAREEGADALMCLPPLLYRGDDREFAAFFQAVADAGGGLPIMAYNNPEASGIGLSPERLLRLADAVGAIAAIKETSGDARRAAALVATGTDLAILAGGDDSALEAMAAGAVGWISGVAVVVPEMCVALTRHVEAGELDEARALYARMLPLARLDMTPKLVQYFKAALDELGVEGGGPCRPPRAPLAEDELAAVRAALDLLRVVSQTEELVR